jgi:predicted permease
MAAWHRLTGGLAALLRRRRVEEELDEELRAYREMAVADQVARGMAPDDALRVTHRKIGSLEAVKDRTRDAGWETLVFDFWRDARYAARTLRRTPAFSIAATLVLALGIGANTAIFSLVNAVMLRPLPVERPGELFVVASVHGANVDRAFSFAAYRQFAEEGRAAADVFAASSVRRQPFVVDGPPEPVDHKWVSGNYFTALGVSAATGRTILPSDESGKQPVAVMSDGYWTRRFGRSPSIVGQVVRYRGTPFTVVGVAPRGFFGESVGEAPELWMPLTTVPQAPPDYWTGHSTGWLLVFARRRADVTLAQARAGFEPIFNRVRDDTAAAMKNPEFRKATLENRLGVSEASGGDPMLRERFSTPLTILLGVVGVVLTIACANVANLLLARAAARRREIAVRLAIGAGRLRLVRQLAVEALVIAALGGALALLIAAWAGPPLAALLAGSSVPMATIAIDASPDARVFVFTAALSVVTAVLFGLWPAFRASRLDLVTALKDGGSPTRGVRFGLGRSLVAAQVALSLILLVGAGLFVRSLMKLEAIDRGFNSDSVLLFALAPTGDRPLPPGERREVYRQLIARAESLPGVVAASASAVSLFMGESWGNLITVEGLVPTAGTTPRTFVNAMTPRHFEVMQIGLARGRVFTTADHETAPRVAIVNETFARQFFGEADPIGRRVGFGQQPSAMMEVIGVVRDAKYIDLREANRPMLYVPFTQHQQPLLALEVRVASDPAAVAPALRRELAAADVRMAVVRESTLRQQVSWSIAAEQLTARLSAVFGALALLLAAVGLYGVLAYVTAQRTGEIGVRMALGASSGAVQWLVLRQALLLVIAGLAIGIPAALAGARLVAGQLYGIVAVDPLTFALAIALLCTVALIAAYLPARRASRVDPLIALRCD